MVPPMCEGQLGEPLYELGIRLVTEAIWLQRPFGYRGRVVLEILRLGNCQEHQVLMSALRPEIWPLLHPASCPTRPPIAHIPKLPPRRRPLFSPLRNLVFLSSPPPPTLL